MEGFDRGLGFYQNLFQKVGAYLGGLIEKGLGLNRAFTVFDQLSSS